MRKALSGQRREYWFPLALLGFFLLALTAPHAEHDFGWMAYGPVPDDLPFYGSVLVSARSNGKIDAFHVGTAHYWQGWFLAVLVLYLATVAWYVLRLRSTGVTVSWWRGVAVGLGGSLVLWLGHEVLDVVDRPTPSSAFATTGVSLVLLGLCALAWSRFGGGKYRRTTAVLGVVLIGLVAAAGLVVLVPGSADIVVVSAALLALGRLERSGLLTAVSVLFLVAGLFLTPGSLATQTGAAVMFGGVIAALLRRARPAVAEL
ncbi:hypothetical protein SAMN05216266_109271 [Amycolatopsis marina]|uniref:Uncharacterized protein n=1 Tax=Amycolatopsis marina TaxID=490629 RepID=A0A1I1AL01_9PSEU|nr:hypothetical protein [Amycolatopsis marina]SFB38627.1 hypothetical protein SAMN05216266_109271 [Amycolatopsis marina]